MKKYTVSNTLIIFSLLATLSSFFITDINQFWMSRYYLELWLYPLLLIQIILYQFLHDWLLHFLFNSLFIYIFWNQSELIIGKNKYLLFFILNTLFVAICLLVFSDSITIGISWFAMAILWYLMMFYKNKNKKEFNWAVVLMVINILIWLDANISFVWHLSWAIFGIIFYLIINKINSTN